ncbi:MAG: glycosyltransferase family 4 protein [Leptolinea sp.]|jgi:glycosyltransferase involved in cell wall biosynthesis|nr:glycosyltransferase family 4 protein [Leptolinea sp.]
MKRLLTLSWCMPPLVMPRSIQVSRLLASLAEFNWKSDVVCVDPDSLRLKSYILDNSLDRPAGGKVRKFPVPTLEDWIVVRGLIRLFPALGILPDSKWVWKNAAFRKCDSLTSREKYDAFISFGQPWTDHLVGLQLKQQSGLPWVAHFSDPWADSPYVRSTSWVMKQRFMMESSVIEQADAVVFVSRETADLVMKKYPDTWRKKTHVIPHGFEPEVSSTQIENKPAAEPLEFHYSGNFYGLRTPENLFKAAARLAADPHYRSAFRIRFAGNISPAHQKMAEELQLTEIIRFEGAVPFLQSQEFCRRADVLLVIDAPSSSPSVFLPSKLVDYLAFNKPILGITPLSGSSAELISRLDCPVVDPLDIDGIARAIAALIDAHRNGSLGISNTFEQTAADYRISNSAKQLDALLASLIA